MVRLNFDGDLLFSGSSDKRVNLWYSMTGERIGSYHTKGANKCFEVTNDTETLVTGSLDGVLEIFDIMSGKQIGFMRRKGKTKYMEFSYGDKYLLVLYESMTGGD
jgi:translation initiation factor 3 subunit I